MESLDPSVFDRDFTVSLWLEVPADRAGATGALAAKWDDARRRGFSLSAISSAGGYNGPGDEIRISFGIDDGSDPAWIDCGRPSPSSNYVSNSLTVHDGMLHAATSDAPEEPDRGHVFRFHGGQEWEDLGKVTKEGASGIGPLIVHGGALYAAAWNYDWTRVHQQQLKPCHVYRLESPGRWEDCGQPGQAKRIFGMGSYGGTLYCTGDDFAVNAYRGDRKWEKVAAFPTYGHPLTAGGGALFVGTLDPATVWTLDGNSWRDIGNPLGSQGRCSQVHSFAWYRGALHAGTWPLGHVARWNDVSGRWNDAGRLGDSTEINALVVYNGKLYGGSIPRGEVYRHERDAQWTRIKRFFGPPGWRPVLVRNMEKPPHGDRRMREWTRVTSLTEHDGQLFASIGSCTSAAVDAPADIRGTVHAMTAGTVVTTARTLVPGWHHVVAVRKGARLSLLVDGMLVAARSGQVSGSLRDDSALTIGDGPPGPYPSNIGGFQAWGRALTDSSVRRIADGGPPA